jgi:hypothetical protein
MGTVGVSAWITSGAEEDLASAGVAGAREVEAGGRRGELGAVGEFVTWFDFTGGPQNQSTIRRLPLLSSGETHHQAWYSILSELDSSYQKALVVREKQF